MHDERGFGEAFQMKDPLPINKWIFVMLNFNDSQVKLRANWNGLNSNYGYRLINVLIKQNEKKIFLTISLNPFNCNT